MENEEFVKNLNQLKGVITYYSRKYYIAGFSSNDIYQEIVLRLWRKKELYNPLRANFNTWSQAIIRNLLKNLYRDAKRLKREPINNYIPLEKLNI